MRTDDFWRLIDQARAGAGDDAGVVAARVTELLARRGPAEIIGYEQHLWRVLLASHRVDLWGAAYLINGGASDDGFDYFRGWLIAQGRATFARAVAEPDSLAELPAVRRAAVTGEEFECAAMLGVAIKAYERATGVGMPADPDPRSYPDLTDEFWDFDDEESAHRRLPRLAALFVTPPEE